MKAVRNEASGFYEVEIDGQRYEFEKWGAEASYDTLLDMAKVIGKPLGLAVAAFGGGGLDEELPKDAVAAVFDAICQGLGDKTLTKALTKKVVAEKVYCDGKKVVFDEHYKDRLDHMFRVLWAGLEVQYGNFFAAILALVAASQPRLKALMNRVPPTSSGQSGAP